MKSVAIKVSGVVQGVWFRVSTGNEAVKLGLSGFVKNQHDGTVYIEATGDEKAIDDFINWCWIGSEMSKVSDVVVSDLEVKHKGGFRIGG